MNITIPVTFRFLNALEIKFTNVADPSTAAALSQLLEQGESMSAALDRLTREVAESRTVAESSATLIRGLAQQIRDLKDDPAKLEALADDLDAQQGTVSGAITENTEPAPNT